MTVMEKIKIAIACDHAGFSLKERLIKYLVDEEYYVKDLGTYSTDAVEIGRASCRERV